MCSCLCKKRPSLCLAHTCWLMTSSRLSFKWAFSQSVARDEGSTRNGRRVLCKCQNKFVYCHCTRKCISYLVWVKHCWNEHWTLVKILVNNHFWMDIKLNNSRCDCQKCRYSCIKKNFRTLLVLENYLTEINLITATWNKVPLYTFKLVSKKKYPSLVVDADDKAFLPPKQQPWTWYFHLH